MKKLFFALFLSCHQQLVFSATTDYPWHATIGNPAVLRWFTMLVYLVAVWRCIAKSKNSKSYGGNYQFWLYLAAFLFLLGINKQLDLKSWFTEIIHHKAATYSWYEYRQSVLIGLVGLICFGVLLAMISFRLYLANSWRNHKITWFGIIPLLIFVVMQTGYPIYIDFFIFQRMYVLNIHLILEISALLLIILGTYFNKNNINPLTKAITLTIKDYVEISEEGKPVQCPQCGVQPLSKTKDGRVFKCRTCGFHYSVRIVNNR